MVAYGQMTLERGYRNSFAGEPAANTVSSPVFLVGCVRSGTTLLRLMLDGHPDLAFDHEFEYAVDLMGPRGQFPDLERYHAYLRSDRIFQDSDRVIDPTLGYRDLVHSFLIQKRDWSGKTLVGATIHRDFDRLLRIWPDARFIHLVRDGRDVSLSIEEYGWTGTAYEAADWWIRTERQWDDLCRVVPEDRRVEIRFEELTAQPERVLGEICDFLDLDYADEMLAYPEHSTYAAPTTQRAERWRRTNPDTIALVEARLGRMLARRRYESSGLAVPFITLREHRQLIRQSRLLKFRKRLEEQGLPLYCANHLARRSRFAPLQRWVTSRLHSLERAKLQ